MPNKAEVHKIIFQGERFDNEDKVLDYLTSKGYVDAKVKAVKIGKSNGFQVDGKPEDSFEGELKTIKTEDGVEFTVGQLKEGEERLEEEVSEKIFRTRKGATADEVVQKYNDYCCGTWTPPSGRTMAEVLSEQFSDGSFPGMYALNDAFYYALYNLVKAGDVAAIKTLTAEYGELISAILKVLNTAGVDTTAVKALFLKEPDKENDMTTKQAKEIKAKKAEGEEEGKAPGADEAAEGAKPGDEAAKEGEGKAEGEPKAEGEAGAEEGAEKKNSGEPAQKAGEPDIAKVVADAMASVMSPLNETLTKLQSEVADLQKATKESLAEVSQTVSKTGERVTALEGARQSRKSADDNGVEPSTQETEVVTEETKAQKAFDDKMTKNRLGIG